MKVLVPLTITDDLFTSSTVAEPDTGETTWVSGGTYAVGDVRIRTTTHRKYSCVKAHSGVSTFPENDTVNWLDIGATNRWRMFDTQVSTATTATSTMTVVLEPGFFNALALYGLQGGSISITVKDAPGGTTIYSYTGDLYEPVQDWYEWLFSPYKQLTTLTLTNILPFPEAEVTVTVTATGGASVGIGLICVGDLRPLLADALSFGGTQYGAKVEPVDYSYIKTDEYGETTIVKRRAATDLNVTVVMPRTSADYAVGIMQEVLATPAAWIATDAAGYAALSVFGLGSGSVEYSSFGHATAQITVKGLI